MLREVRSCVYNKTRSKVFRFQETMVLLRFGKGFLFFGGGRGGGWQNLSAPFHLSTGSMWSLQVSSINLLLGLEAFKKFSVGCGRHCLTGSLILHFKLSGKRWSHFSVLRMWAAKSSGTSSSFGRQVVLTNNYIIISHLVLHSKNIIITSQHYNNNSICALFIDRQMNAPGSLK